MARKWFFPIAMIVCFGLSASGCAAFSNPPSAELRLEEHPLAAAPTLDPLAFNPAGTTQEAVLAFHATERSAGFPDAETTYQGQPAISALGGKSNLTAVLTIPAGDSPRQRVELLRGGKVFFTVDAGMPSPVLPLQGLWTYGGHWALEILFADTDAWAGEVFLDGTMVNQTKQYDEAFGFQLLEGKPFFFYQRNGQTGYSYNGLETDLGYEEVPHYRCCSESALNPVKARNMVAFFAQRGQEWFYVELGKFDE